MNNKKGKIITFSSFKGGTGKTITLLNLAGIMSKQNKSVLLVDLNFESGDLSIVLNSKMKNTIFNALDDISNNRFRDYKEYVVNITENIDLINSLKDPRQFGEIDPHNIDLFLNHVKYKYDFIFVDTAHGFANSTITAIDIADNNIFVMSNDIMDVKSTKTAISIMNDANIENITVILNESIKLDNSYFTKFEIENIIKHKVDYIIPRKYHVKNILNYIMDGKILSLNSKLFVKDKVYLDIVLSLIDEGGV